MDWLASLISNLPLDSISDAVSNLIVLWSHLVANVPPDMLPLYAYVGFSVIVLVLWLFIVRILPSPIGGMSWLAVFAVLLTPSMGIGETGDIAPASIAVIYGLLLKDYALAISNLLPILVVFTSGLLIGFIWQLIRNIIDANIEKAEQKATTEEQENLALASANYVEVIEQNEAPAKRSLLTKIKKK